MNFLKSVVRKSLIIPAFVLCLVLSVYYFENNIKIFKKIELDTLDLRFSLRGVQKTSGAIAVITIDEKSIAEIGRWPWPRQIIAGVIDMLASAQAKVVGLDIVFSEPSSTGELKKVRDIKNAIEKDVQDTPPYVLEKLKSLEEYFDSDAIFARALAHAKNVASAVYFTLPGEKGKGYSVGGQDLSELQKSRYRLIANKDKESIFPVIQAKECTINIPQIARFLSAEGFANYLSDIDGVIRKAPIVIKYGDNYYPSLPVQVTRLYLGIPLEKVRLVLGEKVEMGQYNIPIIEDNFLFINYCGPNETYPYYSFADVMKGKVNMSLFKDKIVLVGGTDPSLWDIVNTPLSSNLPGVEAHANIIESMISRRFLVANQYVTLFNILSIIVLTLFTGYLFTKCSAIKSTSMLLVLLLGYLFLAQWLFNRFSVWINVVYSVLALVINYTALTIRSLLIEQMEKKKIRDIFERCVAKSIVKEALAHPEKIKLGGARKQATILFSDISNFTSTSEKMDPETTAHLLNEYFSRMAKIIIDHKGTIDKYMGDGIMAIFGAPVSYDDHPWYACRTALEMVREMNNLRKLWKDVSGAELFIRIGINTGEMMVGYIGSKDIMNYTAIGSEVNFTKRLEDANIKFGTNIIVSESTYNYIKDKAAVTRLGPVKLKGIEAEAIFYELKDLPR